MGPLLYPAAAGGSRILANPQAVVRSSLTTTVPNTHKKKNGTTHALREEERRSYRVLQTKQRSLRTREQRQHIHPRLSNSQLLIIT